jgi:transcriptional regulator with XRE-family HTH domain
MRLFLSLLEGAMNLKDYRERLGLTQKEAAERAGTSSEYYSQIERGRIAMPNPELRRNIARALGIRHVDYLIAVGELGDWELPGFSSTDPQPDPQREALDLLLSQVALDRDNRAATLFGILQMWMAQDRQREKPPALHAIPG